MNTSLTTGQRLKIARIKKYMTQKEAAEAMGISVSALSSYETDKRAPRDSVKKKMAEFCCSTVQDLFFAE